MDDPDRLALIREVREAIGDAALILVNANDRTTPQSAPFVNGFFVDCTENKTPADWQRIANSLTWAEANLREPRISCFETWYHNSRADLHVMRATTTLALTHSDGYCLLIPAAISDTKRLREPSSRDIVSRVRTFADAGSRGSVPLPARRRGVP